MIENVPRVLPAGTVARIDAHRSPRPAVFSWLQRTGGIADLDLARTFKALSSPDRPVEVFGSIHDARIWLRTQPIVE